MYRADTKQNLDHTSTNGTVKPALFFQSRLTINQPNDVYEQEADAVADKVMRMPDSAAGEHSFFKPAISSIQRKETSMTTTSPDSELDTYVGRLSGTSGQPLSNEDRRFFEPKFGYDFSSVRLHTDSVAAKSAQSINALAYTSGSNIVFNNNQYNPGSENGKRLLGHELTHVVQQTGAASTGIQRKIEVPAGTALDTMGFSFTKTGNVYSSSAVSKSSVHNEIFSAMLHSPRTFKLAGTTSAEVNANLQKHMASRMGIVDFASKKKYKFGAGSAFKMNPAYWNSDHSIKSGVDKQKAMDDLNVHPEEYAIACAAATAITMQGGSQSNLRDDGSADSTDWVPGDWGYITNTKFTGAASDIGLEGENIIYVGKSLFWGHFAPGNTYETLKQWMDDVKSWNGGANLEDQRALPVAGLL